MYNKHLFFALAALFLSLSTSQQAWSQRQASRSEDYPWFSSASGPWQPLARSNIPITNLRFGNFVGDQRIDVFNARNGRWFVSEGGTGAWQPLARSRIPLEDLRFGDFIGDNHTDVFNARKGRWYVSESGSGAWTEINRSNIPIEKLSFGDFVGNSRTDVFNARNGRWYVSESGTGGWREINRSNIPMKNLRFGDFDGDGHTDVFNARNGRWFISSSGTGAWTEINRSNIPIEKLSFGDFDGDGNTDVFNARRNRWYVSYSGTSEWKIVNRFRVTPQIASFVDMDGDGRTDVFTARNNQWFMSSRGTVRRQIEMRAPGASIAVVRNNRRAWSQGIGVLRNGEDRRVFARTIFQVGEISQPVTALGVLRLADAGLMRLDDAVNRHLLGWGLEVIVDPRPTTIRELLTHSAGTNVPDFSGYPAGARLPTLLDILNGRQPATNPRIRVMRRRIPCPDGIGEIVEGRYSIGSFAVLQKAMVDADPNHRRFSDLMRTRVLDPLRMVDSWFGPNIPNELAPRIATGHQGREFGPLRGGQDRYPQEAAIGLFTTAEDLARLIIRTNQEQNATIGDRFLPRPLMNALVRPHRLDGCRRIYRVNGEPMGLGFFLPRTWNTNYRQSGETRGFRSEIRGYPRQSAGVVVLTNGDDNSLAFDVARSIERAENW